MVVVCCICWFVAIWALLTFTDDGDDLNKGNKKMWWSKSFYDKKIFELANKLYEAQHLVSDLYDLAWSPDKADNKVIKRAEKYIKEVREGIKC